MSKSSGEERCLHCSTELRRLALLWQSLVERSVPGRPRLELHGHPVSHNVSPGRLTLMMRTTAGVDVTWRPSLVANWPQLHNSIDFYLLSPIETFDRQAGQHGHNDNVISQPVDHRSTMNYYHEYSLLLLANYWQAKTQSSIPTPSAVVHRVMK